MATLRQPLLTADSQTGALPAAVMLKLAQDLGFVNFVPPTVEEP